MYGDVLGYLSDIGSTESQMERSEVPAKPEWRCRAKGGYRLQGAVVRVRGMGGMVLRRIVVAKIGEIFVSYSV